MEQVLVPRIICILDLSAEQVVALAVVVLLHLITQKMVVFTDQHCEILIHLSLGLALHCCKGIRHNSDQKIKHDYNQEKWGKSKHYVDQWIANVSKVFSIKLPKHELIRLGNGYDVRLNFVFLTVLGQDEERTTEGKVGKYQDYCEDLNINYNFCDCLDKMAIVSKNTEEIQELEPDKETGACIQVPLPLDDFCYLLGRNCRQGDGCQHEHDWDHVDVVPEVGEVLQSTGIIFELHILVK